MKKETRSAVIQLLDHVYSHAMRERVSWQRVNHAMWSALEIAIGSLFEFSIGDFKLIDQCYNSGHWIGESWERWYSLAVAEGNRSAVLAYEHMMQREPIIADDVSPVKARFAHSTGNRDTERLHVGASFQHEGYQVFVTSFNNDGSVNACAYKERSVSSSGVYGTGKPIKRFKIDREEIIAARARKLQKHSIQARVMDLSKAKQGQFLKALGNPSVEEYYKLPLEKIRKAAKAIGLAVVE